MKFGKEIRKAAYATYPGWSNFYFDYKGCKKFLKPFKLLLEQAKEDGVEVSERFRYNEKDESDFESLLEKEGIKIEAFYVSQLQHLKNRLDRLKHGLENGEDIEVRANELYDLAYNLKKYAEVNKTAFYKIMKKHDKISGMPYKDVVLERCKAMQMWKGPEQLQEIIDFADAFTSKTSSLIGEKIARLSDLYASIESRATFAPLDLSMLVDPTAALADVSVSDLQNVGDAHLKHLQQIGQINEKLKVQAEAQKPFRVLMILAAAAVAFAHGSNDVANGIGPFAAIFEYESEGSVDKDKKSMEWWILVMGGIGIVVGLFVLGKKVIETIGTKITQMTFSGGYCAQISAAITVMLATYFGLPVSTTTTLVGSIAGVGMVPSFDESNTTVSRSLNTKVLCKIVSGWIISTGLAGVLTIIIYYFLKALRP